MYMTAIVSRRFYLVQLCLELIVVMLRSRLVYADGYAYVLGNLTKLLFAC